MNYSLFIVLMITLWTGGCKTSKSSKADASKVVMPKETNWVVKYERSPCFGDCPVFVFYLTIDNYGLIDVHHNLMTPGWYYADLDEESVHALILDMEPAEWWREDLSQQPEIADLPGRSIVYKHGDGLRWYAVGGRTSEQSEYIFGIFDKLIDDAQWHPTDLRPVEPNAPEPSDVIVQLEEEVDINTWLIKFENFGIRLVKKVAPNLNYFVVTWDRNKRTANDFLQSIKHDPDVVNAQWDQALNGRSKKSESIRD